MSARSTQQMQPKLVTSIKKQKIQGFPVFIFLLLMLFPFLMAGCQPAVDNIPAGDSLFTDITVASGLGDFKHHSGAAGDKWFPEIMGAGVGFIDYNDDLWPDIILVNGGNPDPSHADDVPAVSLYRNDKNGTFTDVTVEAGLSEVHGYGFGLAVADYDNDGDEDFVLTTLYRNLLFNNEGGIFSEVGLAAGLKEEHWSTAALFFDADNDGWVDLLIGNYVEWSPETDQTCTVDTINKEYCTPELYNGQSLQFYKNNSGQGFLAQTGASGLGLHPGKTLGLAMLDYNKDGLQDIVVANDTERDLLFENLGDAQFEERGLVSGIALSKSGKASAGMGIDVGMVDSTLQSTIFTGNFSKEMLSVFQHQQSGRFRNISIPSGIGRPSLLTLTFGLLLFDVDLDGDNDLLALNGHVHEGVEGIQEGVTFAQKPQLYFNNGKGHFSEFVDAEGTVFSQSIVGRGAAYADIDSDGDLDVLISTNNGPAQLWQNNTISQQVIQFSLEGVTSNKSGLGARVELVVGGQKQVRYVNSGSSYLSAYSQRLTFGLQDAGMVDSLIVTWPSGIQDVHLDLEAGAHFVLEEGFTGVSRRFPLAGPVL